MTFFTEINLDQQSLSSEIRQRPNPTQNVCQTAATV
jgi:hypothetical protein